MLGYIEISSLFLEMFMKISHKNSYDSIMNIQCQFNINFIFMWS